MINPAAYSSISGVFRDMYAYNIKRSKDKNSLLYSEKREIKPCGLVDKLAEDDSVFRSFLTVFPTFRRVNGVPKKIQNNDKVPAAGIAAFAVMNLPEDLRDVRQAYYQIKAALTGGEFKRKYDFKEAQHPFSFFRGTLLHNAANPDTSRFPKLSKWLLDKDKTLFDSGLGRLASKIWHIETDSVKTNIKNISSNPEFVYAKKFITQSSLGELTARALTRTTKMGALFLAVMEGAHIYHEMKNGKKFKKAASESAVNLTSSMAGIGYIGAIGAKYFGPAGSIIGMGLGSVLGNKISGFINRNLNKNPDINQ